MWEESRRIYGRVVQGERPSPVIEISDRSREAFLPVLGFNPAAGRFLVVWTEQDVDEDLRGPCEEIADRYAEENPQLERSPSAGAVAKAIRRTAAMIELD